VALYQPVARDEERLAAWLEQASRQPEAAVNVLSAVSRWKKADFPATRFVVE
jgi:hypothetical protein